MKIGDLFKYRHTGMHKDVTLIILHDAVENKRYLFNIDYSVRVGDSHLLYAKHVGRASKKDIEKYTKISNTINKNS